MYDRALFFPFWIPRRTRKASEEGTGRWRKGAGECRGRGGDEEGRKRRRKKRGIKYNNVSQYMEPSQDTHCE